MKEQLTKMIENVGLSAVMETLAKVCEEKRELSADQLPLRWYAWDVVRQACVHVSIITDAVFGDKD